MAKSTSGNSQGAIVCADDIVVDADAMSNYSDGVVNDANFRAFFAWLRTRGCLITNRQLLRDYYGGRSSALAAFLDYLKRAGRHRTLTNAELRSFTEDRHYNYTSNYNDRGHARTVFLSRRKLLVSCDKRLLADVNGFKKIDRVKPAATDVPTPAFYQ